MNEVAATPAAAPRVRLGLDVCLERPPAVLQQARRIGVLLNQASLDTQGQLTCDVLAARFPGRIDRLFSPQHGLWGEQQANMIESPHGHYPPLEVPVYSLYGDVRSPTREMLAGLDCLVIDLQDVGTRVYTFAWTLLHCLQACAARDLPVVVLDRPNPLGGQVVEGPRLQRDFRSFVGGAEIPLRHGLTLGELALWLNSGLPRACPLTVVPLAGWRREQLFAATGLPWSPPSPNMPHPETALVYPGQVLLEGTNLSEGRGTTTPFAVCGAPFIDPFRLSAALTPCVAWGFAVRPTRFLPAFDKWCGQSCGGVALRPLAGATHRPVACTVALLATVIRFWPREFHWLPPPYEYETQRLPIDILWGSADLRHWLASDPLDATPDEILARTRTAEDDWWSAVSTALLYP